MAGNAGKIASVWCYGNALGAYQSGAYAALHNQGMEPSWIAGASARAVKGAIICGNAPERRIDRLRALCTVRCYGCYSRTYVNATKCWLAVLKGIQAQGLAKYHWVSSPDIFALRATCTIFVG